MEVDIGDRRSDVSAQMAPGIFPSPTSLVSSIRSNLHQFSPSEYSTLNVVGKNVLRFGY